jgi:hypothetical protein
MPIVATSVVDIYSLLPVFALYWKGNPVYLSLKHSYNTLYIRRMPILKLQEKFLYPIPF